MFTVLPSKSPCVNCNMYVGWCNLRPSRHVSRALPDPGGWRRDVKSGDVMRRRAPHGGVAMAWTKKHCECRVFSVCCQTSNYNLFFFDTVLTRCVGVVKLELVSLIETPVISQTLKIRSWRNEITPHGDLRDFVIPDAKIISAAPKH